MRYVFQTALLAGAMICSLDTSTQAAEGVRARICSVRTGRWQAATPPPGVCFQDDTYFYSGKIGGGTTLRSASKPPIPSSISATSL
jgi:hypothetical protein